MTKVSDLVIKLIPTSIKKKILLLNNQNQLPKSESRLSYNESFSQEGEDMVLSRFFPAKPNGFYVDIGAHHPTRFSNTYKFYLMGWRGINIDAMPGSMRLFNELRQEDINLELPVSDAETELTYYMFNEPALNTLCEATAKRRDGFNDNWITETRTIRTWTLANILDRYLPKGTKIDFMSVDVEGLDLNVIKSNDWTVYRPGIVLVEDLFGDLESVFDTELYSFMKSNGYKLVARTYNTLFFRDNNVNSDTV